MCGFLIIVISLAVIVISGVVLVISSRSLSRWVPEAWSPPRGKRARASWDFRARYCSSLSARSFLATAAADATKGTRLYKKGVRVSRYPFRFIGFCCVLGFCCFDAFLFGGFCCFVLCWCLPVAFLGVPLEALRVLSIRMAGHRRASRANPPSARANRRA